MSRKLWLLTCGYINTEKKKVPIVQNNQILDGLLLLLENKPPVPILFLEYELYQTFVF